MFIRNIVAKFVLHLKDSGESDDHLELITGLNFDNAFKTRIPSREEWVADSILKDCAASIFTDGTETETRIGLVYFLMIWILRRLSGCRIDDQFFRRKLIQ